MFFWKFAKFFEILFSQNNSGQLLLEFLKTIFFVVLHCLTFLKRIFILYQRRKTIRERNMLEKLHDEMLPNWCLITKSRLQNSGCKLNGTTTLNSATTIHPFYIRNSGFARKNQGSVVTLKNLLNNVVH